MLVAGAGAGTADDPEGLRLFQVRVRPALEEHCYMCHSAQIAQPKAGLRLDTRAGLRKGGENGPIVEPGKPDDSLLIRVLEHTSEIAAMPPKGKLPDALIADFRAWIEHGAPDPR